MKFKAFLIAVIVSSYCNAALAQDALGGARFGMNIAKLTNTEFPGGPDAKMLVGPTAGLCVRTSMERLAGFQFEFLYSQLGVKDVYADNDKILSRRHNMQFPFLFSMAFGDGDIKGIVNVGPYLGIYLGEKYIYRPESGDEKRETINVDPDYDNIWDSGFTLGGGAAFDLGNQHIIIPEFRWGMGFTKLFRDPDPDVEVDPVHNLFFALSVTFMIGPDSYK